MLDAGGVVMVAGEAGGEVVVVALVVGWLSTLGGGVAHIIDVDGHVVQLVAAVPGAGHGHGHVIDADGGGVMLLLLFKWWWWWSHGSGSRHCHHPNGGDGGGGGGGSRVSSGVTILQVGNADVIEMFHNFSKFLCTYLLSSTHGGIVCERSHMTSSHHGLDDDGCHHHHHQCQWHDLHHHHHHHCQ